MYFIKGKYTLLARKFAGGERIHDIRERSNKNKRTQNRGFYRAANIAKRKFMKKGQEALRKRSQEERNEIEEADDAMEGIVMIPPGKMPRTIREKEKTEIPRRGGLCGQHHPKVETEYVAGADISKQEPHWQDHGAKKTGTALQQRPMSSGPVTGKRTRDTRESSQPERPYLQLDGSLPAVYQGQMKRAKTQYFQEGATRPDGERVRDVAYPTVEAADIFNGDMAPDSRSGGKLAPREKGKGLTHKEKGPDGFPTFKAGRKGSREVKKAPTPSIRMSRTGETIQNAVVKRMEQYGRQNLIQRTKEVAKSISGGLGKTAVAVQKAVKTLVNTAVWLMGGGVFSLALCVILLISAVVASPFGLFFSGEQSAPGAILPGEAMRQLNDEYEDRMEALKAGSYDGIEVSGQPATWRDVLAVFAVKTAGTDDGVDVVTLDPDRIERLRAVYWDMTTITSWVERKRHADKNPDDDVDDSWTERILHIAVTGQTADEAADSYGFTPGQKAVLAELQAPENNDLWLALLYDISGADNQIVAVAMSQLGNVGGDPYWSWYGFEIHVNWCACFVSWCANECGYIDSGAVPKFASCSVGSQWFKDRGQWADSSIEPVPGMLIFFDWDNGNGQDGRPDHVGIVERVENGRIYTVEGNSGDQCREKNYPMRDNEIYGYGIPRVGN